MQDRDEPQYSCRVGAAPEFKMAAPPPSLVKKTLPSHLSNGDACTSQRTLLLLGVLEGWR